jgi:hypothetical protein
MKFMESRSKRNEAEPHTEARLNSSTEESNEREEPPQPAPVGSEWREELIHNFSRST